MRFFDIQSVLLLTASLLHVQAQTYSKCNPMERDCPGRRALSSIYSHSFSKLGESSEFRKEQQGEVSYGKDGCYLKILRAGESGPQIESNFYIMYGRVDVTMRSGPGQGIVTSIALISDTLDEIDWEFLNNDLNTAHSNYFAHGGDDKNFDRGELHRVENHANFHTYSIIWKPTSLKWSIDGNEVRELTPAGTKKYKGSKTHFPQSPMEVKIGIWAGGDVSQNTPGTVTWAGGETDFSKAPFEMVIESVRVEDYSTGNFYSYEGRSGMLYSVRAEGGQIFEAPNQGIPVPSQSCSSTKTTLTTSSTSSTTKSSISSSPLAKGNDEKTSITKSSTVSTSDSSFSSSSSTPLPTKTMEAENHTNESSSPEIADSIGISVKANDASWTVAFGLALGWYLI